jgi:hypothetical protein
LEVAIASIQAASLEKVPVLISIDATVPTTVPHQTLLRCILELGRDTATPVGVEVIISPNREVASWWLSEGVLALTLSGNRESVKRLLKGVMGEAEAHGAEVGVEISDLGTVAEAEQLGRTLAPSFFRLAPREQISEMREYIVALRTPVIAGNLHITPKRSRELVAAGCAGLTLGEELHEAFTGGVRTGLRSRTVMDPAKYLGYGGTAVRELVRAYTAYFHS